MVIRTLSCASRLHPAVRHTRAGRYFARQSSECQTIFWRGRRKTPCPHRRFSISFNAPADIWRQSRSSPVLRPQRTRGAVDGRFEVNRIRPRGDDDALHRDAGRLAAPDGLIVINPAASSLASVRIRFGCARPVAATNSATDTGFGSRIRASRRRLSGVSRRKTAATSSPRVAAIT